MSNIDFLKSFAANRDVNSIGLSFTINNDGTHSFSITVGDHSLPISSNDAQKLTLAQIIEKAFKDNE